jgi:hypothetical protein
MKKLFEEYNDTIMDYCVGHGLDFERLSNAPKSWDAVSVAFLDYDHSKTKNKSMIGGPPLPIVLWLRKKGDAIEFEQTEHTAKYLRA